MKLIWSGPSRRDIVRIDDWLSKEAHPDTAALTIQRIRERARKLRDFPRTGSLIDRGVRSAPVARTNYLLIYRVTDCIEILRVRHGREDWLPS